MCVTKFEKVENRSFVRSFVRLFVMSTGRDMSRQEKQDKCLNLLFKNRKQLEGPVTVLEKGMKSKSKVLVVTRHKNGIRGVCSGYIEAFDKHHNIVLRDVDEQYTVLHRLPSEKEEGTWKKKLKYYKRHIPQVLIRGESIVLVSLNPNDEKIMKGMEKEEGEIMSKGEDEPHIRESQETRPSPSSDKPKDLEEGEIEEGELKE